MAARDATVGDVLVWLDELKLAQYKPQFTKHSVDGRTLLRLSEWNLYLDLGVQNGVDRLRIMDNKRKVKAGAAAALAAKLADAAAKAAAAKAEADAKAAVEKRLAEEAKMAKDGEANFDKDFLNPYKAVKNSEQEAKAPALIDSWKYQKFTIGQMAAMFQNTYHDGTKLKIMAAIKPKFTSATCAEVAPLIKAINTFDNKCAVLKDMIHLISDLENKAVIGEGGGWRSDQKGDAMKLFPPMS